MGDLPQQVLATPATQLNQLLKEAESDADPGWPRVFTALPVVKDTLGNAEPVNTRARAATPSRSAFVGVGVGPDAATGSSTRSLPRWWA